MIDIDELQQATHTCVRILEKSLCKDKLIVHPEDPSFVVGLLSPEDAKEFPTFFFTLSTQLAHQTSIPVSVRLMEKMWEHAPSITEWATDGEVDTHTYVSAFKQALTDMAGALDACGGFIDMRLTETVVTSLMQVFIKEKSGYYIEDVFVVGALSSEIITPIMRSTASLHQDTRFIDVPLEAKHRATVRASRALEESPSALQWLQDTTDESSATLNLQSLLQTWREALETTLEGEKSLLQAFDECLSAPSPRPKKGM